MKQLYKRFGITIDSKRAESIFQNKVKNQLESVAFCSHLINETILWEFCDKLGIDYCRVSKCKGLEHINYQVMFNDVRDFSEYLLRIQTFLDILWETDDTGTSKDLGEIIELIMEESPIDLGYRIKVSNKKAPQILPSGCKLLDEKVVENVLGLLEMEQYAGIRSNFEEGLREFLHPRTKATLKNVVEDMTTACDNTVKMVFNDSHLGFKHLFKDNRWQKLKLNAQQKQIFFSLNDWMDKIKHDVITDYSKEDIESIIYLSAIFIRLAVNKR